MMYVDDNSIKSSTMAYPDYWTVIKLESYKYFEQSQNMLLVW